MKAALFFDPVRPEAHASQVLPCLIPLTARAQWLVFSINYKRRSATARPGNWRRQMGSNDMSTISLEDQTGEMIQVQELFAQAPLTVLVFFRGDW